MMIFSLIGKIPSWDGCSDFLIFSCQLDCSICARENEFISVLWPRTSFAFESSEHGISDASEIVRSLNACHKDVLPYSFPHRTQRIANEDARKDISAELVEARLVFRRDRMIFNHRPEGIIAHKMVLQNAWNMEVFPSDTTLKKLE